MLCGLTKCLTTFACGSSETSSRRSSCFDCCYKRRTETIFNSTGRPGCSFIEDFPAVDEVERDLENSIEFISFLFFFSNRCSRKTG